MELAYPRFRFSMCHWRIRCRERLWWRLIRILADIFDHALWTCWQSCCAHIAPMQQQPVMRILVIGFGHGGNQGILYRPRTLSWREPRAVRDTEDMRIYRDGCLAKHHVENDARGLAA